MRNKPDNIILLGIIGLTFLFRAPFFFPSSIDWDEGTFILMGQSILDGYLPYTELWDNKPPLLFFIFAIIVAIANKSIIAVRIIGSIFVVVSAFFIYQAGKQIGTIRTGLIASILFIAITGEMGGNAVMSEIIVSVPLTSSFLLAIDQEKNTHNSSYFFLGCLLSITNLIRLNLAYLTLFVFLYYLFICFFKKRKKNVIQLAFFLGGILTPSIIIAIPYIFTGNLSLLYKSVIEAPLIYSISDLSRSDIALHFITIGLLKSDLILSLLWIGFFSGLFVIIYRLFLIRPIFINEDSKKLILLLLWLIAIAFSIVSSGHTYPHYLIQLLPFMAIVNAIFLSFDSFHRFQYILFAIFIIGLLDYTRVILEQYFILLKSSNDIHFKNDVGYQVADFLRKNNPNKEAVYLMDFQIVHWLTQSKPINKMATHPSNIGEDSLLKVVIGKHSTTANEIQKILDKNPLFIIKEKEVDYLRNKPEAASLLSAELSQKYTLASRIEQLYIYKRKYNTWLDKETINEGNIDKNK